MSRNEKLKEQIGWLKVVFAILTATVISLIGFIVTTYQTTDNFIISFSVILVFILIYGIIVTNKIAFKKIDELEEI